MQKLIPLLILISSLSAFDPILLSGPLDSLIIPDDDPYYFWMFDDQTSFLGNYSGSHFMKSYNWSDQSWSKVISIGQGPGEVSNTLTKYLVHLNNNNYILVDYGLARLSLFDNQFNYINSITSANIFSGGSFGMVNDSTLISLPYRRDILFKLYRIIIKNGDIAIKKQPLVVVLEDGNIPELRPLTQVQPHLKRSKSISDGKNLFIAFHYSSIVLKFSEEGIEKYNFIPEKILLPDQWEDPTHLLPDASKQPTTAIDLAVDKKYLYMLYSGKTALGRFEALKYLISGDDWKIYEPIHSSNTIYVVDKSTLKVTRSLLLPVKASRIEITEKYIYLLVKDENNVIIYKYKKPRFYKL